MREAGSTEESGQGKQRSPENPIPEHPQHCPCGGRKAAGLEDLFSRGLQTQAVTDSRRTDGFAAAAAEAAVQVLEQCRVVSADLSPLERSHEDNAAARAVPLVSGSEIGWASRQTEAAVHTGIESGVTRHYPPPPAPH